MRSSYLPSSVLRTRLDQDLSLTHNEKGFLTGKGIWNCSLLKVRVRKRVLIISWTWPLCLAQSIVNYRVITLNLFNCLCFRDWTDTCTEELLVHTNNLGIVFWCWWHITTMTVLYIKIKTKSFCNNIKITYIIVIPNIICSSLVWCCVVVASCPNLVPESQQIFVYRSNW